MSSCHTNSNNFSKDLKGFAAKRWKIGGKSRAPGPGGIFRAVKILPNKLGLVSSWHTNSKNSSKDLNGLIRRKTLENWRKIACPAAWRAFQSSKIISRAVKTLPNKLGLVLSWHTNSEILVPGDFFHHFVVLNYLYFLPLALRHHPHYLKVIQILMQDHLVHHFVILNYLLQYLNCYQS